ncbi:dTDP-4-dehydrorhamnose 3,5-epimerase [Leptothermofonsia sp. ETS-13]|uniref:dTDP-4-dehydrorhamnose 3,5-epimerase n=1 Tax=Leptothermofonsia sp. ETS-13 TaxID=3035696 RepID=UPI003B9E5667
MKLTATPLPDAFVIELEKREDDRGFFARTFCVEELKVYGIQMDILQSNIGFNYQKGTVRGFHYQVAPAIERKLVRCTRGAIYDVIVDLRPNSPTYRQHIGVELTADNYRMLYVPDRFAHGYQTLTDNTEVFYQVSSLYNPACERGFKYDDPAFDIRWPLPVSKISEKDVSWVPFTAIAPALEP